MLTRSASLAVFLSLAPAVRAADSWTSVVVGPATPSWTRTLEFPRHDPADGALRAVRVRLDGSARGSMALENLGAATFNYTATLGALFALRRPDLTPIGTALREHGEAFALPAFDGVLDFGGASGVTFTNVETDPDGAQEFELTSPADLALFSGPAGSPGAITLTLDGSDFSFATGEGGGPVTQFLQQSSAIVSVRYDAGPTAAIPPQPTSWTNGVTLPRFDPRDGALSSIRLRLDPRADGAMRIENLAATPATYSLVFGLQTTWRRPDLSTFANVSRSHTESVGLAAFDGTLDFAGASGAVLDPVATNPQPPTLVELASAADLALFSGPAGAPGTITLEVLAQNTSTATGPGGPVVLFEQSAQASVSIEYVTVLAESFCAGDGSGTACPCGNDGALDHGCANSANPAGATLRSSGRPSISIDELVLHGAAMPAGSTCLYFQGTEPLGDGAGVVFGDGLRCIGGSIVRLGVRPNDAAGASSYPSAGDAPISSIGAIPVTGATRYYQCWYRNSASFCTLESFNLTNGWLVGWTG